MNRPCTCDIVTKGSLWSQDQCRACWLFYHAKSKSLEWGGNGDVFPVPPMTLEDREKLQPKHRPALHCAAEAWEKLGKAHPQPRVGTHLKMLVSWFNIKPEQGCQCESRAITMNLHGPGWCRDNMKTILDWLETEASKRGLPFSRIIGEQLVNLAIHNAIEEFKRLPDHYPGYFGDWTSVEEYKQSFLTNDCHLWPHTFGTFANAQEGFRQAFEEVSLNIPAEPQWSREKGIAICGGGRRYFPGAYAACKIIRWLGCDWPIELWHLEPGEREPDMDALLSRLPGEFIWRDGLEVAKGVGLRCAGGWELKAFALAYSAFRETVLLDADCYPVHHPQELLDQQPYRDTGAIFYPDSSDFRPELYDWFGAPRHPDDLSFESGQLVVDKSRHWKPTWLSLWLNHNSAYTYKHVYGDKDTFLLAWLKAGHEFSIPTRKPDCRNGVFVHKDFQGREFFVHRIHAKPQFPAWGKAGYCSDQRPIDTSKLPHDHLVCAAIDTGNTYVSPSLSTHEPWLAHTIPTPPNWQPSVHPDNVIDGLYISDQAVSANQPAGRYHIVTLNEVKIGAAHFPMPDGPEAKLETFIEAVRHIYHQRLSADVLVHCYAGISRSASACAAVLALVDGIDYDDARRKVRERRPKTNPCESLRELGRQAVAQLRSELPSNPVRTPAPSPTPVSGPRFKLALDIGANKGVWSAELSRRYERVIAFEPQPAVASHLAMLPKVEVLNHALWHEPAAITLYFNGDHQQSSVFFPFHWGGGIVGQSTIPAVTLDSLELAPDFVKIDTEGAEANILRGGAQTIRTHKPTMLVECHGAENERECRTMLEGWGYTMDSIANPITQLGSTWLWARFQVSIT